MPRLDLNPWVQGSFPPPAPEGQTSTFPAERGLVPFCFFKSCKGMNYIKMLFSCIYWNDYTVLPYFLNIVNHTNCIWTSSHTDIAGISLTGLQYIITFTHCWTRFVNKMIFAFMLMRDTGLEVPSRDVTVSELWWSQDKLQKVRSLYFLPVLSRLPFLLFLLILGMEWRALQMLHKCSTTEPLPQPLSFNLLQACMMESSVKNFLRCFIKLINATIWP